MNINLFPPIVPPQFVPPIFLYIAIEKCPMFLGRDILHCTTLYLRCTRYNYWIRLSVISGIFKAEVGGLVRIRQITPTEALIILVIPRKPNSIII